MRALIRFCGLRILRKSEVEQSERTRVSEDEICDNEVKQITRPRGSKIKEASPAVDTIQKTMTNVIVFLFSAFL